jgi:hypothetical protein
MAVTAHVGHWSVTLIYLAPFLAVAGWIGRDYLRRRREGRVPADAEER